MSVWLSLKQTIGTHTLQKRQTEVSGPRRLKHQGFGFKPALPEQKKREPAAGQQELCRSPLATVRRNTENQYKLTLFHISILQKIALETIPLAQN